MFVGIYRDCRISRVVATLLLFWQTRIQFCFLVVSRIYFCFFIGRGYSFAVAVSESMGYNKILEGFLSYEWSKVIANEEKRNGKESSKTEGAEAD